MKYWVIIFSFGLLGCSKSQMDDCITSAGPEITIERSLESFSSIQTNDKLKVVLVQDSISPEYIKITGPRNLLGQITSEVDEGELVLDNRNTCNFMRSFKVEFTLEVHLKSIDRLEINGASGVSTTGALLLKNLSIAHNALSDVELELDVENEVYVQSYNSAATILKGKAKTLKGSIEEVSDLNALELKCEEVLLDQHSPLDCYIDGTEIIFVKIYNDGNIYYKREPSSYKDLNYRRGEGDLILYQ